MPGRLSRRLAIIAVASGLLMDLMDSTALATALPTMARAFQITPLALKFALTAYLATVALLVPASGWLSGRIGYKRLFLTAMSLFVLGSACCGLSTSLPMLICARVLQGVGGSMMTPIGRSIVVASAPRSDLIKSLGWFTMPAIIGPLLGPPLAGLLIEVANWRWIFFLNLPIGVLGFVAVALFVPEIAKPARRPFDALGFGLIASTIITLLALSETQHRIGPWWAWLSAGLCTSAAYWLHARRSAHPVLELTLFRHRNLSIGLLSGSLVRMAAGATPFLLPLMLQGAMGYSPLRASVVTLTMALGTLSARFTAPALLRWLGFKHALISLAAACALVTLGPAFFYASTPIAVIAATMLAVGVLRGALLVSLTTLTYADVAADQIGQSSILLTVAQQISLGAGLSLSAWILASCSHGRPLAVADFVAPFVTIAFLSALAIVPTARLHPDAAETVAGRGVRRA